MIESWFPTVILYEDLNPSPDVHQGMLDYVKDFEKRESKKEFSFQGIPMENATNITGDIAGDYKIFNNRKFSWLNKEINHHCLEYLRHLGVKVDNYRLQATKAWPVVVFPKPSSLSIQNHIHKNSTLSAVYYLECDNPETGSLLFECSPLAATNLLPVHYEERNNLSHTSVRYAPLKNRLIIFPSSVMHQVESYYGTENSRYSVSYDIVITEKERIPNNGAAEYTICHPNHWKQLDSS